MTYRWLDDLDAALREGGVPYTEVGPSGLDPTNASSWRNRGRPASTGNFDVSGVLCHHTASPAGTTAQGDINVILAGNSQAPGPISQLYIGRDARCYLIAAGRANHGGKGRRPGLDTGGCADMNAHLIGIEAGNNGVGERWSDAMCEIYANTVAALIDYYGFGTDDVYLHATTGPPTGGCNSKIDPAGPWTRQPSLVGSSTWDLNTWRDFVSTFRTGQPPIPPPGGTDLSLCLIIVDDAWAKFAGDMDTQGVVNTVRYLGPRLNSVIGFKEDNVTPRLAGTEVLHRRQAQMIDFNLSGVLPKGDKVTWTTNNFYQGD